MHDTAAQRESKHTDLRMARENSVCRREVCEPRSVLFGVLEDRFCEAAPYAVDAHAELLDHQRERGSSCVRCICARRAGFHAHTYVQLGSRVLLLYTLYVLYDGLTACSQGVLWSEVMVA